MPQTRKKAVRGKAARRRQGFYALLYLLSSGLYRRYRNCTGSAGAIASRSQTVRIALFTAGQEFHLAPKIICWYYYSMAHRLCQAALPTLFCKVNVVPGTLGK